jgi:hypothetical protein
MHILLGVEKANSILCNSVCTSHINYLSEALNNQGTEVQTGSVAADYLNKRGK